ncbi:MAG: hypothetical protein FWF66_02805 [Candidatus Bathyarchaeota archaeon]|nr:hypothetical protein [Candidatus Termiticorpusculum sp.]
MPVSICYRFSQPFVVLPKQAYLWCTDFSPQDPQFLGYIITGRQVVSLSEGLILLIDVFRTAQGTVVEKQKLVHLYPDTLSWVMTHITGPTKYSQFRYEILEDPDGCHLNYEALHVEYEKVSLSSDEKLQLAQTLCKRDSEMWRLLAVAMEQDLK